MKYNRITYAIFLRRDNRFIATVLLDGSEVRVHVKNTGRCRELLIPGCQVILSIPDNPSERKTPYDLIAVYKTVGDKKILINMDSQAPNDAAFDFLKSGRLFSECASVRREVTHKDSRFDFYVEDGGRRAFVEVKGVTLEDGGVVMFPDAPTERGAKHIRGLTSAMDEGFEAYVLFVIQMSGVRVFRPNRGTDPDFAEALHKASARGVKILAYDCAVSEDGMALDRQVKVEL